MYVLICIMTTSHLCDVINAIDCLSYEKEMPMYRERIRHTGLIGRVTSAEAAASLIQDGHDRWHERLYPCGRGQGSTDGAGRTGQNRPVENHASDGGITWQ